MNKELIKFLQEKQSEGNWLGIANHFSVQGTSKQKSDYVRRLWKKLKRESSVVNFVQVQGEKSFSHVDWTTTSTSDWKTIDGRNPYLQLRPSKKEKVKRNINNVLFIGDLHLPFSKEGYLEFCIEQYDRFNCGTVIFSGDIVDHHAQSFHNTDPDGLSAKDELILAVKELQKWYKAFPQATVLLGNHDRIVARKLTSCGLSKRWMKPLHEVLETPNWDYVEEIIYNNILYVHGEGGTAFRKAQQEMISVCQGHLHTEGYVQFLNGGKNFAMQVGCGIDFETYAFAYAQRGKKPVLACGVIPDQSPILIPFLND